MQGHRQNFWNCVLDSFSVKASWEQFYSQVRQGVIEADNGWDLVRGETPSDQGIPNGIGGPNNTPVSGLRSFLINWSKGEQTSIHGHGQLMIIHLISGRLSVSEFQLTDTNTLKRERIRSLVAGDSIGLHIDNDRQDNFIHRITCLEAGWSLHIYADDPGRGRTFSEQMICPD